MDVALGAQYRRVGWLDAHHRGRVLGGPRRGTTTHSLALDSPRGSREDLGNSVAHCCCFFCIRSKNTVRDDHQRHGLIGDSTTEDVPSAGQGDGVVQCV